MPLEENQSILEGIMTSLSAQPAGGSMESRVNIAPMGPIVDEAMTRLIFRPFKTSTTYKNLKATGEGVFHVTDDALLVARAAIGRVVVDAQVSVRPAQRVTGLVLTGACRYYEVEVVQLDDRQERTRIEARVVASGRMRDFFGFNRAKHAVLEAAILATRVHLTGPALAAAQLDQLQVSVDKTGSTNERRAMDLLRAYVNGSGAGRTAAAGGNTPRSQSSR